MELFTALRETPIPGILLAVGIFLLAFSLGPRFKGNARPVSGRQRNFTVIGLALLLIGSGLYLAPFVIDALDLTKPPTILGVTIRKSQEGSELVYYQEINFYDDDGNTYLMQRHLVDLSDPAQRELIQVGDSAVDAAPELQRIRATAVEAWHCGGRTYVATVEVTLLDRNGNKSESIRYAINCME